MTDLRSELRALLRLAAPIAAAQAGFALMGLIDTAVVGRLGSVELAGVGLGNGVYFAFVIIGMGVVMGLDPLLAQAVGAKDARRARELLWQGVWLALWVSVVMVLVIAPLPLFLERAGVPPDVSRLARHFVWLRLPGLPFQLLFQTARSLLQAAGRVRSLVVATVVANVANFFLDVWFVFGGAGVPQLGSAGSAIATSLCTVLLLAVLLAAVPAALRSLGATQEVSRRVSWTDQRRAARVGLPIGLQLGAETSVFALVGLLAGRLGAQSLAAHQVAISLASFTFCFAVGIGNAGSVRVGWAIGARDVAATRRAGLTAFTLGTALMSVSALAFFLVPGPIARLVAGDPAVIATTMPLLAVAAVFQISDGIQAVGAGVLRGAGDTRFAFFANVAGHWLLGLPIALLLAQSQGVRGLWWGLCVGLSAVAAALLVRFERLSARGIAPLEGHPSLPH